MVMAPRSKRDARKGMGVRLPHPPQLDLPFRFRAGQMEGGFGKTPPAKPISHKINSDFFK